MNDYSAFVYVCSLSLSLTLTHTLSSEHINGKIIVKGKQFHMLKADDNVVDFECSAVPSGGTGSSKNQ